MHATAYIVDDQRKARELVRAMLQKRHPTIKVLGESGNVAEAVEAITAKRPDILFLDVDLGEMDGFDLLRRIGTPRPL
ncbi:MAG: response regulator, partial [Flavobacteriales bacterium]|nr:response regulator [Flavobacteriales bacterium]